MPTTPKTVVGMPIIRYSIESIEDTSNTMPNITATMLAINPTTKRMRFIENSPFILFYSHDISKYVIRRTVLMCEIIAGG